MPTFELTGPDGGKYQLTAPDEGAALSAFATLHGGSKEADPVTANQVMRATATGVPIIGGALNKLDAATNAVLAPVIEPFMTPGPDSINDAPGNTMLERLGNRYSKSLELQNKGDARFAEQHPVVDTAAKITGGVGGMIPAIVAAPAAFGAAGTLPQMIGAGAASGAAVSGIDAAVRGEDIAKNAAIGGTFGAGGPLVARAIGAGVRALTPKGDPIPQNVVQVGKTEVPLSTSQVTGDAATSAEEQVLLRGGRGEPAQKAAQEFDDLQNARIGAAKDEIGAGLDPSGTTPATAPQAAGERILGELTAAEQARFQTEQARLARVAADRQAIRSELSGPAPGVMAENPQSAAEAISGELSALERSRASQEAARAAAATREGGQLRGALGGQDGAVIADSPFTAAEAVGSGVAGKRDAAVAATRAKYDALKAEPGSFEPDVPLKMSDNIRARLNAGEDPIWVDPDTTSKANEALKLIDQTIGKGMFANAAARGPGGPVGPVAEAIAGREAAPPSEAAKALDELLAMGVNPAKARASVAGMQGADALPSGPLAPHSVAVPGGGQVEVAPKVVEARSIRASADAGYDPALQPRNRARAASDAQINDMAANLDPKRLGVSSEADRGAPIVGADGMVESGNGRVLALRKAYEVGGEPAQRYREWLQSQGVDISRFKEPVLVRERTTAMTPDQRRAFTVGANQSSTLSLSASERALTDARAITPDSLSLIRNPTDLGAVENRDFVRSFMQQMPAAERGALMTANGDLSSEGLARVRNAVLGKAYGDTPVLARIAESTNDDIKSISNALVAAAPEWAGLKAAISAGRVPAELDATPALLDAVARTAKIRGRGVSLADDAAQADAFARPTPESDLFMRMFYDADGRRAASSSQVSNGLRFYAQEAAKVDAGPGLNFGLAPVAARDILEAAAAKIGAPAEVTARAAAPAAASAAEAAPEVGLREMDAARKRLVTMYSDAKKAAMAPGGSGADQRAMARILHEFDNEVIGAFDSGKFSGDSDAAKRLLTEARASHAAYRQTFTSRGPSDPVGRSVEKILGRYTDTAATPDEIAKLSYGSLDNPGGGQAIKVAQRLKSILGGTSPEWGAYKQGLLSALEGSGNSPAKVADRIDRFLDGTHGKGLAQVVLSGDERAMLRIHANNLRAAEPVPLNSLDSVDKVIARITGRDGGLPATPGEVADYLYSRSANSDNGTSIRIAQRIKQTFGAESPAWATYKQGLFSKLVDSGDSLPKVADGIETFLSNRGLAQTVFTPGERARLASHATELRAAEPLKIAAGDEVEKVIARLSGRDGAPPASPGEVVDRLFSRSGTGNKGISVKLATRLKQDLSPEGWTAVRQGMWSKLTSAGEGKIEFGPQALSQRLHEFLNESGKPLAQIMFSEAERQQMAVLAKTYRQMIPVKGTTNPSGTAPMLAKIAGKASNNLLAMLGAAHSGGLGLAVGWAADRGLRGIANARGVRDATRLFYGAQRKPPIQPSFAPIALAAGAAPNANQR